MGKEAPALQDAKPLLGGWCPQPRQPLRSAKADTDPRPPCLDPEFRMLLWVLASCPARPSVAAHQEPMGWRGGGVKGEVGVGGGGGAD